MQPALALALSSDGVVLYANSDEGWLVLGRARFSARNMGPQMAVLRRIAQSHIDDPALPSLLLVPEDQLLWQRFESDGVPGDAGSVNAYLLDALEGLTPYEVENLRFDWRRSGAGLDAAIVAIDTLREAERFTALHGFTPVGVGAMSSDDAFTGTAFFGLVRAPFLADGTEVITGPHPSNIQSLPTAEAVETTPDIDGLTPAEMAARVTTIDGEKAPEANTNARPARAPRGRLAALSVGLVAAIGLAFALLPNGQTPVSLPQQMNAPAPEVTRAAQAPAPLPRAMPASAVATHRVAPSLAASPAAVEIMRTVAAFDMPDPRSLHQRSATQHPRFTRPGLVIVPAVDALAIEGDLDRAVFLPPEAPSPPPPQGMRFDVDPNGLVLASLEGALAPGGYRVVQGQPPTAPPPRPLRNADTEGTTRLAATNDPLVRLRPPPRPNDLAERWERAQFGGRTRAELRAMRPAVRPADKAAIAAALQSAANPQVITASAQIARPTARPASITRAYRDKQTQAAIASAASTAAVLTQPKPTVTKPKPAVAKTVPQTQKKTPEFSKNAPTTKPKTPPSNVASRATDSNELNLKKVNLLGTFGKSGAMRALVRLPSGRVINVSVGDRVDGGRVVAIGQSELRYVKSNRNYTLKMPKG